MSSEIKWETSYEKTLERSESEGKPVFLDFFNPG